VGGKGSRLLHSLLGAEADRSLLHQVQQLVAYLTINKLVIMVRQTVGLGILDQNLRQHV
jgi:hypothetical protein